MVNRSQALVLVFFASVLIVLVTIRVSAPGVYSEVLKPLFAASPLVLNSFMAAVIVIVVLASVGTVARWRWMFWIVLVAFAAGILRLPASMLELGGVVPSTAPSWYLVLQAVIGAIQFVIGLLLFRGYRKAGPWGAF